MAQQGARIRLPHIGVGTTLMAAVAVLGLVILAGGLIAILSFVEIRRSLDPAAAGRTGSIVAASRLGQASEALAGLAPSLFAKGFDRASLADLASRVATQRQRLQEQVAELTSDLGPAEAIATIRSGSAELSEIVGLLATAMSSRAAEEETRNRALAATGAVLDEATMLSGQPGGAPIARWLDAVRGAVPDVFTVLAAADDAGIDGPSTKAGVVLGYAAEIAAAGETAAGSRAAAPALPGLHSRLADAVTGDRGVFAAQRRIVDLNEQLRQLLGRNEAAARRMSSAVGTVMETARADIGGQSARQGRLISASVWWLVALTLAGALIALGTVAHVRNVVARRRQALRDDTAAVPNAASVTSGADSHDKVADMTGAITKVVAETDGRDRTVQPDSPIATSS